MIRIIICCTQGMSSGLLVRRMKEYVNNHNLDVAIKFSSVDRVLNGNGDFDLILLGPQIRAEKKKVQNHFPDKKVEVVEMKAYGRMDGESVIKSALSLFEL